MAKKASNSSEFRCEPRWAASGMTLEELAALVCKFFIRGKMVSEIVELIKPYGVEMKREDPYRLISYAAKRGWLRYHAPIEADLRERLKERHTWLGDVEVVQTASSDDVARHAAKLLLRLAREHRRGNPLSEEFHIGFAGGNLLRKTARCFEEMLRTPDALPKWIVFHAMVAGFNANDPITDPNAFFAYFGPEQALQVRARFVGLLAPGIVDHQELRRLRAIRVIQRAIERASEIDVIVSSLGHWKNGCSGLYNMYSQESPKSLQQLLAAGCIGDMMWRPIGRRGPIEIETEHRTMTLMELNQLPDFIARNKRVVLLVGPCATCHAAKSEVLEAILAQRDRHLVTDLVVDSRSASGLFYSQIAA